MNRKDYPADWEAISRAVRDREGNCCAWCGVPNGAIGYRSPLMGYFYATPGLSPGEVLHSFAYPGITVRVIRIVLTVAHLGAPPPGAPPWHGNPHDKADCRPENLAALCQRCHLGYDRHDHAEHAAATRRRKRIQAGQTEMAATVAQEAP